ncbi:ABC transporter substrate-binding protein [Actibacterium sp.]|uniref:ABC transporter substrate-binding protein n=1 Tax=Actibacterium sp. TaxID=1872125 RepID=UPI0035681184
MKKYISGLAVAAALTTISTAALAETTVGLLLPKSGVFAALGNEIDDGFVFALEEAGRADDIKIVREDTEVKPPVGLAKARKLVLQDEVDVIVGVVSSGVLGAMRDFIHEAEVPLIVSNAGNDAATGAACSPYITRVSFSNGQVNRPMGQWMHDQGIQKVYTLASDYAAGHQMIDNFTAAFTEAGGEIIGSEYTPFGQTKDFGPYLTNARAANPDAIFVFYAGGEAISFVKQYGSFGMAADVPLFGSGFLTSPLYVAAEGDAAVGVKTSLHYVPTLDTPENNAFVAAFKERFGRTPSEYAVQGYDSARVLLGALDSGATDRKSIAAALPKVSYTGPRGPLEIDPATNNVVQNIYIYETVKDGDALTQKVVGVVEGVRDAPNGCALQ